MDLETDCKDPVPLPNLKGDILEKVIDWATHFKEEIASKGKYVPGPWDKNFFMIGPDTMYHLILAANYLDIKDLMEASTQVVADGIK